MIIARRQGCLAAVSIVLLTAHASRPAAAEWQSNAGVAVGGYFSDNICLARSDEESDYVATVTPDVRLTGESARADVALNARVEFNSVESLDTECPNRAQGAQFLNRRSVIPSGAFRANFEAVENWLTLNADAFAGQNPINPFRAGGEDGINGRGNTNVTYRWGAGATAQRRIRDAAEAFLVYNYNEQYNAVGVLADSSEHRVNGRLGMVPDARRVTLYASGFYSEVSFDESSRNPAFTNSLSSAQLNAAYQLTRSLQVNAYVGEEWNVFTSANDEVDGQFWDVGLRWAPNDRVSLDVGTGERFFGSAPRFSLLYRHKRSRLEAGYVRSIQFPRNLRAPPTDPNDPFGPDFGRLPGDPVSVDGTPTFIGQTPILNERFTLRYLFSARRTDFALRVSDSQQTQASTLAEGEFRNAQFTATRRLSSKLSVSGRVGYRESEGAGTNVGLFGQNVTAWRFGLSLSRELSDATRLSLALQSVDQTSDFVFNEFAENRITLNIRHNFR